VDDGFCLSTGRAERRRGATEGEDGVGEARSIACVDRHILFITRLRVLSRGRSPSRPPSLRAFPSHGQPGQLRRLGRKSSYASTYISSLRPSQACAALEGRFGGGRSKLSRRLRRGAGGCGGAKGRQSPCRTRPATPRTFPDTQHCPPMTLAKPQVAAPPPSM
jgi:hypothetical protein